MRKNCFGYPVEFVEDAFGDSAVLADIVKKASGVDDPKVLIVADMNVVQHVAGIGAKIGRYVQAHGIHLAGSPVVVAGGEKVKADNLQNALRIVSAILSAKLGRNDIVLALGGGTILDVAGYAAAQARGGVKLVRLPTTPAAMMDAAYANWAGVDSATVKDALRVPSVPVAVVIDTGFAATVLDGVWKGGIGEAVRLAVASDASLMKLLLKLMPAYRRRDMGALAEIVAAVAEVRAKKGAPAFAQWAAPRLESLSRYKLPHGYAVAIGICIDLGYAVEKGLIDAEDRATVVNLLNECGALDGLDHSVHLLSQADSLLLGLDAWKLASGSSAIAVPTAIGKVKEEPEPDREVFRKVLKEMVSVPAKG